MKEKRPSFQFYPADWLSNINVVCLTNEQRGGYIQLLCHCWLNKGVLPNKKPVLLQLSSLSEIDLDKVLSLFIKNNENIEHNRLNKEIAKQDKYKERQSRNGKLGGRPRKANGLSGLSQMKAKKRSSSSTSSSTSVNKKNIIKKEKTFKEMTPKEKNKEFFNNQDMQEKYALKTSEMKNTNFQNIYASLIEFVSYWTELTQSGKKQRWEEQQTFEIPRRFATWLNNNFGNKKPSNDLYDNF